MYRAKFSMLTYRYPTQDILYIHKNYFNIN